MKNIVLISSLLLASVGGFVRAQPIPVMKFDQLEKILAAGSDTLYVVNFWATWCAPCVKELPYFEEANRQYKTKKVKVLLVSLDERKDLTTRVAPFLKSRKIQSRVVLLDEPDADTWIDKLAPEWSGALPMTLVINKARKIRQFYGKPLKEGEVIAIIKAYNL